MTSLGRDSDRATHPIHHERPIRIITIGAGAGGLLIAFKLRRSFHNYQLAVYDKNTDVSGTWHENRYPGCACDVPSHLYCYTFWPKYDWSHFYSSAAEIKEYFKSFAEHFDLGKYIKLRHQVIGTRWDDAKGIWEVDVKDLESVKVIQDTCHILINATGFLNEWEWPKVEGLDTFKGDLMHTANWPAEFDFRGKTVGLIGNGSSAIQVLPAIQPHVKALTTFIRSPTYIGPPLGSSDQRAYTASEKHAFRTQPGVLLNHRKEMENSINGVFGAFIKGSPEQIQMRSSLNEEMKSKLTSDPSLASSLIPNWSVGCRRFTPGPGYLEALQAPNVRIILSGVTRITPTGCISADGQSHTFEALICATGFNTSFTPRFPVVNSATGHNLQDEWATDPRGYLATAAAGFPNYLTLFGPNSPTGNGPVLPAMEKQADYILRLIDRYQTENMHAFAPKREAVDDFNAYVDWFMARTVWSDDCRSWYKKHSADGRITGLWPGSALHFHEAIREVRWDDWEVRYVGNRFAWLGNGFSQLEMDPEGDLSWYIGERDNAEHGSRRKRRQVLTRKRAEPGKAKL